MNSEPMVLVVDDDDDIRISLSRLLAQWGYQACGARDGAEALLMAFEADKVRLIILDLKMPGLDGLEVLTRLRKTFRSNVPVIVLSGRDGELDRIEGYLSGADLYLTKPFDPQTLRNAVDHYAGEAASAER